MLKLTIISRDDDPDDMVRRFRFECPKCGGQFTSEPTELVRCDCGQRWRWSDQENGWVEYRP